MLLHGYFSKGYVVDTPADLPAAAPLGVLYETLEPLRLYAYGAGGGVGS
jgi:hypothetical protein